jgi:hypothetical protein
VVAKQQGEVHAPRASIRAYQPTEFQEASVALLNFCRLIVSTLRLMWRLLKFSWRNSVPLRAVTDQTAELLEEPLAAEALAPVAGALTLASTESVHLRPLGAAAAGLFTDPIARPLVRSSLTLAGEALRVTRANTTTVSGLANDVEQLLAAPATVPLTASAIALATRVVALAQSHPAELANLTNRSRLLLDDAEPLIGTAVPQSALDLTQQLLRVAYTERGPVEDLNTHLGLVLNDASFMSSVIQLASRTAKAAATHSQRLEALSNEITTLLNSPQTLLLQIGGIEAATAVAKLAGQSAVDLARLTVALRDLLQDPAANPLEANAIKLTTRMLEVARANSADLATLAQRLTPMLSATTPLAPSVFTLTRKSATLFLDESEQLLTLLENSPALLEAVGKGLVAAGDIGMAAGFVLGEVEDLIGKTANAVSTGKSQIEGAVATLNTLGSSVSGFSAPTDVGLSWPQDGIKIWVPFDAGNPLGGGEFKTLNVPNGVDFTGTADSIDTFSALSVALEPLTQAHTALTKLQGLVDPVVKNLYKEGAATRESGVALQQLSNAIDNL